MEELLGTAFKGKQGDTDSGSIKSSELVGIYFSASWSPPCKRFTPLLAEFYREVNSLSQKLEIIFVSSCKNEDDCNKYYEEMPWIMVPYSELTRMTQLRQKFQTQQIPTLVILNQQAEVVCKNGRELVQRDGEKAFTDWGGSP